MHNYTKSHCAKVKLWLDGFFIEVILIKNIIYLIIGVIVFNTIAVYLIDSKAYANELSHEEMIRIYGEGYAESYYSTLVEANARVIVNEQENREALEGYIQASKDYLINRGKSYLNSMSLEEGKPWYSQIFKPVTGMVKEMGIGLSTLTETGWEMLKSIFEDNTVINRIESDVWNDCFVRQDRRTTENVVLYAADRFCRYQIVYLDTDTRVNSVIFNYNQNVIEVNMSFSTYTFTTGTTLISAPINISSLDSVLRQYTDGQYGVQWLGVDTKDVLEMKNILNLNTIAPKNLNIPIMKSVANCPEGQKQVYPDGKGGFNNQDGSPATLTNCTVIWQPHDIVRDNDGNLKIGDDELITLPVEEPEPPADCDGVLCFLGQILKAIGNLGVSIAGTILEGIGGVLKYLFIPDSAFWENNMRELEEKFFKNKISESIDSVEELSNVSAGNFGSVEISLMGVDNLKIIDSRPTNEVLDSIHSWVRGVFYPLLILFNINQLYRLVRGTSLIGIVGGKKEE